MFNWISPSYTKKTASFWVINKKKHSIGTEKNILLNTEIIIKKNARGPLSMHWNQNLLFKKEGKANVVHYTFLSSSIIWELVSIARQQLARGDFEAKKHIFYHFARNMTDRAWRSEKTCKIENCIKEIAFFVVAAFASIQLMHTEEKGRRRKKKYK